MGNCFSRKRVPKLPVKMEKSYHMPALPLKPIEELDWKVSQLSAENNRISVSRLSVESEERYHSTVSEHKAKLTVPVLPARLIVSEHTDQRKAVRQDVKSTDWESDFKDYGSHYAGISYKSTHKYVLEPVHHEILKFPQPVNREILVKELSFEKIEESDCKVYKLPVRRSEHVSVHAVSRKEPFVPTVQQIGDTKTVVPAEILRDKMASIRLWNPQVNINFGCQVVRYRPKPFPKHPFFPEMIGLLSLLLKFNPQIKCLILLNVTIGAQTLRKVELTKNELEQISRYDIEETHIVQLCTQTIGNRMLCNHVQFDFRDFVREIVFESEEVKMHEPFADRVLLNMICCELTKNNTAINKAFPSMVDGDDRPNLVCIVKADIKIFEFRGFRLKTYMINDFLKDSIKAENSVEKETNEYQDIVKENFTDINMTLAHHYEHILSKHSNIEAIRVSFVKQSKTNYEICPCIVIYCHVKSVVPYKEGLFPQTLCHPDKSKSFKTDVRIGYFSLCPYFALSSKDWNKELAMGCSIGEMNGQMAATIGPFVEVIETQETCFLTVRHLFPPFERNVVGVKVVQPADCDLPPVQQNPMPGRECGEVVAGEVNNEIDAALVKIADERKPSRGHFITVTREELNKTGLSPTQIPTFDDGSVIDVVGLTIKDHATTRPILKIGAKTGLTKGMLTTVDGVVKANDDDISLLFNGIANPRYFRKQLFVDFIKNVFCQPGDSGSAVFLLDEELKLHCIGIVLGMMSDFTAVVTPINTILNELGHKYNNRTLKLKNFRLEQMDEESQG